MRRTYQNMIRGRLNLLSKEIERKNTFTHKRCGNANRKNSNIKILTSTM